jgi:hypothetical protein
LGKRLYGDRKKGEAGNANMALNKIKKKNLTNVDQVSSGDEGRGWIGNNFL